VGKGGGKKGVGLCVNTEVRQKYKSEVILKRTGTVASSESRYFYAFFAQ
jgi:hypothetical protein